MALPFEQTPFGRLPAELRNRIYEEALGDPDDIQPALVEPALTRTSRQIRAEALPLFFARTFIIKIHDDDIAPAARALNIRAAALGPRTQLRIVHFASAGFGGFGWWQALFWVLEAAGVEKENVMCERYTNGGFGRGLLEDMFEDPSWRLREVWRRAVEGM